MANTIVFFGANRNQAHSVRIFDESGTNVAGPFNAPGGGGGGLAHRYSFTIPGLPPGFYYWAAFLSGNQRLRKDGSFLWSGTDVIHSHSTIC